MQEALKDEHQPVPVTEDEIFAANAVGSAAKHGLYVEVHGYTGTDGYTRYYALTLKKSDFDTKLEAINAIVLANHERRSSFVPAGMKNDPPRLWTLLPWDDMSLEPTFVMGAASRREALTASMQLFHEQQQT